MNFDFSDDQKLLRDQTRKFLENNCSLAQVREVFLDENIPYDKKVWQGLAELGVLGASIPEQYEGAGLGMLELCVVAEECGRAIAPTPFSSSVYLATEAIKLAASDAQKQKWLPKLAKGEAIGTFAFAEPSTHELKTIFDGKTLSGEKKPVADGGVADIAVVVAKQGGELVLVLAELGKANSTPPIATPIATIDPTRKHATLAFNNTPAEKLESATGASASGEGEDTLSQLLDRAAILMAFEQLGGADRALEFARDYANERYAFGRPIGSFQAIKHKLADAYILNQVARSNCYYAAMILNDDNGDLPSAAAAARLAASEAFMYIAQENVQAHGGVGFTWEADTQFFYRRAKLLALALGGKPQWQERLVNELEKRNAA